MILLNSKEAADPQTCGTCSSPTNFKIYCRRWKKSRRSRCHTWNDINAESCKKCNGKVINRLKKLNEAYLNEEYRFYHIFLRACNNFNSDQQNLYSLFYGFIRSKEVDHRIPLDIIKLCIMFAYDIDKLKSTPIADAFDGMLDGCYDLDPSSVILSEKERRLQYKNYEMQETNTNFQGCFDLVRSQKFYIRKVWKIKILDYDKITPIDLDVGLYRGRHCDQITHNFSHNLKIGDVICVTFILEECVAVGINGCMIQEISLKDKWDETKDAPSCLMVQVNCNITIEILNSWS